MSENDKLQSQRDAPPSPIVGENLIRIVLSLIFPVLSAIGLGLSFLPSPYENKSPNLAFGPVNFAGHSNWVFRDDVASAQVVLSSGASATEHARFLTAFPHGNTGTLAYFRPVNNPLGVTVASGSLVSVSSEYGQTGITGLLEASGDFDFGVTILGSVRAVRDYVEGGGVLHPEFEHSIAERNDSSVTFKRKWLHGDVVQYLRFDAEANAAVRLSTSWPPVVGVTRLNSAHNATLRFTTTFNFTSSAAPRGLSPAQLFVKAEHGTPTVLASVLKAIKYKAHDVTQQLAFLSYSDLFLAGGWRFLTYFGRDTLITLKLLLPVLSPEATEGILAAVIQRIGPSGEICHEETVGDYASFLNIRDGKPELGSTPVYDYAMADTDFLLLPVLADYFLTDAGKARKRAFLARKSTLVPGTFEELVRRNAKRVLDLTHDHGAENLIPIRAYPVGNWRDSHAGLGWGHYPFDLNCPLFLAAPLAIGDVLPDLYQQNTRRPSQSKGCGLFEVTITPEAAETSLAQYIERANLSPSLLYGAGSLNSTGTPSAAWNVPNQTIGGDGTSTIYALSIEDANDRSTINVLNSDIGFSLAYDVVTSPTELRATVEALQPYPRGLLTNVGMVVASAAYDTNATRTKEFSNLAYHGAVAWSWQQALMAAGLSKQLGKCLLSNNTETAVTPTPLELDQLPPAWCNDTQLTESLQQAQTRLWDSIAGSESVLYTEVWSPVFDAAKDKFDIGDLGAISPDGTEGDAFQLWSYAFLGLVDPRTSRPVAAGFFRPSTV